MRNNFNEKHLLIIYEKGDDNKTLLQYDLRMENLKEVEGNNTSGTVVERNAR